MLRRSWFYVIAFSATVCWFAEFSYANTPSLEAIRERWDVARMQVQRIAGVIVGIHEIDIDEDVLAAQYAGRPGPQDMWRELIERVPIRAHSQEKRTYTLDLGKGFSRVEVEDLRDLAMLVAESHLPERVVLLEDSSAVALQRFREGEPLFWAHYNLKRNSLVLDELPVGERSIYEPPIDAGLLPEHQVRLLSAPENAGRTQAKAGQEPGRISFTFNDSKVTLFGELHQDYDCKLALLEERDAIGRLRRRIRFGEYKRISDVWYPFLHEHEEFETETQKRVRVSRTRISDVRFGAVPVDAFALQIRANATVSVVMARKLPAFSLLHPSVINLDKLVRLGQELRRAAIESSTPLSIPKARAVWRKVSMESGTE